MGNSDTMHRSAVWSLVQASGQYTNTQAMLLAGPDGPIDQIRSEFRSRMIDMSLSLVTEEWAPRLTPAEQRAMRVAARDGRSRTVASIVASAIKREHRRPRDGQRRGAGPVRARATRRETHGRPAKANAPPADDPEPLPFGRPPGELRRACLLVSSALALGRQSSEAIKRLVDGAGVSTRTYWRAHRHLGIQVFKVGASWYRQLPPDVAVLRSRNVATSRLPWESEIEHAERHRATVLELGSAAPCSAAAA
jgi:hypothetical protein